VFDFSAPRKRTNVVGGSGTGTVADVEHHPLDVSACIAMLSGFVARQEKTRQYKFRNVAQTTHTHKTEEKKTYRPGQVDACAMRINRRDAWICGRVGPSYSPPKFSFSACSEANIDAAVSESNSAECRESSSDKADRRESKSPSSLTVVPGAGVVDMKDGIFICEDAPPVIHLA
jgi:hypothetical protein